VGRPTKSAAEPAEKPSIIFVSTRTRKPMPLPPVSAVLDTNVVLDWLVFRNPGCSPLAEALAAGRLRWIATAAMRDELAHVLGRVDFSRWSPDPPKIWRAWDDWAMVQPDPAPTGAHARIRCTDRDDQKFVDLALHSAGWLLSRDRAVLKLARRAAPQGLRIVTPERWISENPAPE
jgi:predicted nucleic acid-binding protein